jgi:hypothetical protein
MRVKILISGVVIVVIAASLYADYKWKQWMAARRRDRQE